MRTLARHDAGRLPSGLGLSSHRRTYVGSRPPGARSVEVCGRRMRMWTIQRPPLGPSTGAVSLMSGGDIVLGVSLANK